MKTDIKDMMKKARVMANLDFDQDVFVLTEKQLKKLFKILEKKSTQGNTVDVLNDR